MPRLARVVIPDCPHHVTQRGNERRDLFFSRADRQIYLRLLKEYTKAFAVDVLGYCLMTNHVHLLVTPQQRDSLAKLMRNLQMRFSQYRHAVEQGSGHVWQGRYYSCPIELARMRSVLRYIELNPLRAGLVADPALYEWSSARVHLGAHDPFGLVEMADWRKHWTSAEWRLVLESTASTDSHDGEIREATYSGRPYGSREFVGRLEEQLDRRLERKPPGRPRKADEHQRLAIAAGS